MDFRAASPDGAKAISVLHTFLHHCGLERSLLELVKLRASQINGCAHCIDMHAKELRADGDDEQRLYLLNAWKEAPIYSERERAALAWTEAVTLVAETHVPDDLYECVRKQFNETELANLTLAIVAINGANRLNVAFRTVAGSYRPSAERRRVGVRTSPTSRSRSAAAANTRRDCSA
ncbi:MAG TPA: carboxymuconolactone decarboxylase family protein [Stellaceae bacterium]|nr:carboxymuconolactone decarboxylase family protein [Stellaceae bacterium]